MTEVKDSEWLNMPPGCASPDGLTERDDWEAAIQESQDFEERVKERFNDKIDLLLFMARNNLTRGGEPFETMLHLWEESDSEERECQMKGGRI